MIGSKGGFCGPCVFLGGTIVRVTPCLIVVVVDVVVGDSPDVFCFLSPSPETSETVSVAIETKQKKMLMSRGRMNS